MDRKFFHLDLPIIQAPMAGGITPPELVAAVSNTGALGSLGAGYMNRDEIRQAIRKIKSLTDKPFNVNLFIASAPLNKRKSRTSFDSHGWDHGWPLR